MRRSRRRAVPKKSIMIVCIVLCVSLAVLLGALTFPPFKGALLGAEGAGTLGSPNSSGESAAKPAEPDELLTRYTELIASGRYEQMYALLSDEAKQSISEEAFIARNENIYEGIGANNISLTVSEPVTRGGGKAVAYSLSMDTLAGEISFDNEALFVKGGDGRYYLDWSSQMIFPSLTDSDRVRVNTFKAERGSIFDRNGELLAGKGVASSVGFVPGKMRAYDPDAMGAATATDAGEADTNTNETAPSAESAAYTEQNDTVTNTRETAYASLDSDVDAAAEALGASTRAEDLDKAAELLGITIESIERRLSASYVRDDTFVELRLVSKEAYDLKEQLLTIPGIKIIDASVRFYPLGIKAAHLIGYIQNINAEELAEREDMGYTATSVLGKAGLESIFEEQLRAIDGREVVIIDEAGETKAVLAQKEKRDGEDLHLTIDAGLQTVLYDQFAEDKSASVSMNPQTGEVLALVSTPAYDPNDFVLGMSPAQWAALNADENLPLYNRFQAALCPGSSFKAITGAIGIETGLVPPDYDFGRSGLTWRKDGSWGDYYIKTLREYGGKASFENALTYSDNIYFAKAALKIGAERFARELINIGFEERIPFEYPLYSSIISGTETFTSELQLADSGYGQGEILANPIHLASIYSAFINGGDILQPRLTPGMGIALWKKSAFSADTVENVFDALVSVVEDGTGTDARIRGVKLGGKTGTAEIKQSKDDAEGTELGWFVLFNAQDDANKYTHKQRHKVDKTKKNSPTKITIRP